MMVITQGASGSGMDDKGSVIYHFSDAAEHGAVIASQKAPEPNVTFCGGVLTIDKDGMIYKGKRIEDAGEAYAAFMEVMGRDG